MPNGFLVRFRMSRCRVLVRPFSVYWWCRIDFIMSGLIDGLLAHRCFFGVIVSSLFSPEPCAFGNGGLEGVETESSAMP